MAVLRNNPFIRIQKNWKAETPRRNYIIPRNIPVQGLLDRLRDAGFNPEFKFENRLSFKYFDTQDGLLFKSGARLMRDLTENTWVLIEKTGPALVQAWPEDTIPDEGEFAARVRKLIKGRGLIPLMIIQRDDKKFELAAGDGVRCEVVIEEYIFSDADAKRKRTGPGLFYIPELTAAREDFFSGMLTALSLRPFEEDILAAGLSSLGLPLPGAPIFAEYAVGKDDTVQSGLEKIVMLQGYRIWAHTEGTLRNSDAEFLHDMRVATRRLRSALRFIPEYFDEYFCLQVKNDLAWIGDLLGRVRDMDVFIEKLEDCAKKLGIPGAAAESIIKKLTAVHESDRRILNKAIKSFRFSELMDRLMNFKKYAFFKDTALGLTLREMSTGLILAGLKRTSRAMKAAETGFASENLHALRIACKRLRYTCEFFTPLFDERIKNVIRSIIKFQDCLGEHQDAIVAIKRLESLFFDLPKGAREQSADAINSLIRFYKERSAEKKEEFLRIKPEYELISGGLNQIMETNSTNTSG